MFEIDLLKGKTIIITGGGTGLGKSMAVRFAELGANLVLTSRRQDVLDETSAEIKEATGAKILTVAADIRLPEQVADMVAQSVSRFKKIDGPFFPSKISTN